MSGRTSLAGSVDHLRRLFRQAKTRPGLGAMARSLREFAVEAAGDHVVNALLDGLPLRRGQGAVPNEKALGVVHG